jgi:hypothetical protein
MKIFKTVLKTFIISYISIMSIDFILKTYNRIKANRNK